MDPAVYSGCQASTGLRSAPGHEGIHGLSAGLLDGEDMLRGQRTVPWKSSMPRGQLAAAIPLFWGPGHQFRLLPREGGVPIELLTRWPRANRRYRVVRGTADKGIGSRELGYHRTGHSLITGWANMSRDHIFHDDVDGDGNKGESVGDQRGLESHHRLG